MAQPKAFQAIRSFGKGGQIFIANLFSGVVLTSSLAYALFQKTASDAYPANVLNSLSEVGKIGSTMTFRARQIGLRFVKLGDAVPTIQQLHDLKRLIASMKLTLMVGSSRTIVAEFSGFHFLNTIDCVTEDDKATPDLATSSNVCGAVSSTSWCNLPVPIEYQPNVEIKGEISFGLAAIPASLLLVANDWAAVIIMAGEKQVQS